MHTIVVLAKHEIAPWRWFLREPKHVGAIVGILIVLIFLRFYNCVHQFGVIKKDFFLFTPPMKMEQSVPKRRHIKFRSRRITQKKEYSIQNRATVWDQECARYMCTCILPESGFIWAETCSCHWALSNKQLVADGCLLGSLYSLLSVIALYFHVNFSEFPGGAVAPLVIWFLEAAVQVLCTWRRSCTLQWPVFVTYIWFLALDPAGCGGTAAGYRSGGPRLRRKARKRAPCPLIHPA